LEKALQSLEAIAFKPFQKDRSNIDATIQRFEFTIELFWKTLKTILGNYPGWERKKCLKFCSNHS
jgi:hypothetical protein